MPSGFATALALAGGAVGGWGKGELEAIKKTRDEKLRVLELDRAERLQKLGQEFQAGEGDKNRAAQKAQTEATLGLQRELGLKGLAIDEARLEQTADLTREQIASNEGIAQMQIDADNVPTMIQTETGWAWQKKDGTMMPAPIDPATGKPLNPKVDPKNDTPQISNYKYLMTLPGMDPAKAETLAFDAGNDPAKLKASLYETVLKTRVGDFNIATDEDISWATKVTDTLMPGILGSASGDAPSSAAEPAATDSAPAETTTGDRDLKFPPGTTPAQGIAWARKQVAAGKSKAAIAEVLKANDIEPSQAGL